jgi:predicted nucleic acid-binding protein
MKVYLDSSVILSRLLNQPNQVTSWGEWQACYTSMLTRVECLRTVDRLRLEGSISDDEGVEPQRQFNDVWGAAHKVVLTCWNGHRVRSRPCGAPRMRFTW